MFIVVQLALSAVMIAQPGQPVAPVVHKTTTPGPRVTPSCAGPDQSSPCANLRGPGATRLKTTPMFGQKKRVSFRQD